MIQFRQGAATGPTRQAGTVLVAEDEPLVRDFAVNVLTRAGCHTVAVANGQDAITALVDDTAARISLVLLDLVMPGMPGREVYERIRTLRPTLPVLFWTAYESRQFERFEQDRFELLEKPVHPAELIRVVHGMLAASASHGPDRTQLILGRDHE